ncbi:Bax inhibitor-1/YccA family protein [Mucilaginibacter ginkgonis]|uniref:Bax inhibitor-1/YccA family protein n=1 Tax=Mucilaginibacter ginkgonis TaxID=2682091 RepID=A0A6I4I0I2_9SPHI|nr:Bax inhibitor-1/YccA family protein [Mucilaginibacter ginkgonis]QQL49030.1 Bax inhibitor-1/YccA family protein [Mucilaginibacter ginkgonis]
MDNNSNNYYDPNVIQLDDSQANVRRHMASVFLWMFVALGISAFCAYAFATTPALLKVLVNTETGGLSGLGYVALFGPLAFVMIMSFGINRISYPVLALLFIAYSALMGVSLSFILLAYTSASVLSMFVTASALFGVMAIAGYTTHQDLTKFGSLMIVGLVGVLIATVVNMFMHNQGLDMVISYVGVAVFIGLTAYDVQKQKRIGQGIEFGSASGKKLALMGALNLYLDFVNMFLFLLRIFGRRR